MASGTGGSYKWEWSFTGSSSVLLSSEKKKNSGGSRSLGNTSSGSTGHLQRCYIFLRQLLGLHAGTSIKLAPGFTCSYWELLGLTLKWKAGSISTCLVHFQVSSVGTGGFRAGRLACLVLQVGIFSFQGLLELVLVISTLV